MPLQRLLIANRGEVAIRIARAAAELGIATVAVYSSDDAQSLHVPTADTAHSLAGTGAAAYLDIATMVQAARSQGCDAVHPGYGFLSENAAFAEACEAAGLVFVGPTPAALRLFGDKTRAKELAAQCDVPLAAGTGGPSTLEQVRAFVAKLEHTHGAGSAALLKAVAGGGGRGMRIVHAPEEVDEAYARCASEAQSAFGNGDLYVERLLARARHIEVQIVGDGQGGVTHLWERECSLQRRHQKLVEVAPSPTLAPALRQRLLDAALRMARAAQYRSLGTFEFLVDADDAAGAFIFIESNPRLQVEHTVTEAVTGIDLVQAQLRIAGGTTLTELGLQQQDIPAPRGHAMQLRINMETMAANGSALPASGTLRSFALPGGPGVRVDSFAYAGYRTSTAFDSLLAKLIVHSHAPDYATLVDKAYRALGECHIDGVATNLGFLKNLLCHPQVRANDVTTRFVEQHAGELMAPEASHRRRHIKARPATPGTADDAAPPAVAGPPGCQAVPAPMQGRVVRIAVQEGDRVRAGDPVAVLEAMKVEAQVEACISGIVRQLAVAQGEGVLQGQALLFIEPAEVQAGVAEAVAEADLDAIRADLAEVLARRAMRMDAGRPEAVARRRKTGQRTARENIADLCDTDSFMEYGGLILAQQRKRKSVEELERTSPADGMVSGIGAVNGALFGPERARTMVLAYDYTVFAGTQGFMAHRKKDRMFMLAEQLRIPLVFFTEGGGGRPGDTDYVGAAGLDMRTFWHFGRLSALVPLVGINSGRCFAGNAALLGCCDVVIATQNSNIGMAGPAMIEGGGLGVVRPEDIGPTSVQVPNGVIDILVQDEAEAVRVAKQYLGYFQGDLSDWQCADQRHLRALVPENRMRVYDIRKVLAALADTGSVLELRAGFGAGMLTALVRIEGRPIGVIANNPMHLGGAIDAQAADKCARFLQLCDAFDLPLLTLVDTPGFMVGPESEKSATVRKFARMFNIGANLEVPLFTVALRKGYGLGALAMVGGASTVGAFAVAWPTAEFGPMGLEGAVRLAYRNELAAIADLAARQVRYEELVAHLYQEGKAMNAAAFMEMDEVIDPADTRQWLVHGLRSTPRPARREKKKRPYVDTW